MREYNANLTAVIERYQDLTPIDDQRRGSWGGQALSRLSEMGILQQTEARLVSSRSLLNFLTPRTKKPCYVNQGCFRIVKGN